MQRHQFHQKTKKLSLYPQSGKNVQRILVSEKKADVRLNFDSEHTIVSEAYSEIVSCFQHLTKDITL